MIYLYLFLFSFSLSYIVKEIALRKSLLDIPNERSSHTIPTPQGGGVAIAISWFSGLFYLYETKSLDSSLFYALLCGIVLSIVSFFDDIYSLSPKIRLLFQAFVSLLGLYFIGGVKEFDLFGFIISNSIFINVFAFFLIIWFINLYNFLDGIDGYAGSEAIFLGIAGYLLYQNDLFLVLIVSVLGFLIWNWQRAKIFMGDTGSTLLGYNVAIFTLYYTNQNPLNFWIWIILFGIFWFDATFTLFRRYKNGEKLLKAHKKHAYQRLTQAGFSHMNVVLFAMMINIFLLVVVSFIKNIFIAFIITILILYMVFKYIDKKREFR